MTDNFIEKIKQIKYEKSGCSEFHSKVLGERLLGSTPYFYPFIVEFALIGASVAYIMSNHIGKRFQEFYVLFSFSLITWAQVRSR